jgi:dTMP kinase
MIAQRLGERGPHNRFQLRPGSAHAEIYFYKQATERLKQAGFDVLRVNCNQQAAHHVAAHILDRLTAFFAPLKEQA